MDRLVDTLSPILIKKHCFEDVIGSDVPQWGQPEESYSGGRRWKPMAITEVGVISQQGARGQVDSSASCLILQLAS